MAKIDKQITKNIKEGNYEDVPVKTSRDSKAKHEHKYPERIREKIANYEKQAGYTAKAKEKAAKRLEELTEKNQEARLSRRRKSRIAHKQSMKDAIIADYENASNDLALGE